MGVSHQEQAADCEHRPRSGMGWIFVAFALMAVVLLREKHGAHIPGIVPYLILFSCPADAPAAPHSRPAHFAGA
jgi:hypothetical protein